MSDKENTKKQGVPKEVKKTEDKGVSTQSAQEDSKKKEQPSSKATPNLKKADSAAESQTEEEVVTESQKEAPQKEEAQKAQTPKDQASKDQGVQLNSIVAFKEGMSSIYNEQGRSLPVTVLKYRSLVISQIKTQAKDKYNAIQWATGHRGHRSTSKASQGHFKGSGFERGAKFSGEFKQAQVNSDLKVGQFVSIHSLAQGDHIKVIGYSKGRGFSGVVKKYGFAGGPASHGSRVQRKPGSIGNCTKPGRVMKGRKMPGQFGASKVTIKTEVVRVLPEKKAILVKGPVPGAMRSLLVLEKINR